MPHSAFTDAMRDIIRDEQAGLSMCTLSRVKEVNEDRQRVTVELKNDPEWIDDDIPLVSLGADDGGGDIHGVTPGQEVLVLFSADDIPTMAESRGATPEAERTGSHSHAIALPLGAYTDDDEVPDHEPGERVISHTSGAKIRMGAESGDDIKIDHPGGMELAIDETDGEAITHLTHDSGVGVTVSENGVAITPGDDDGAPHGGYGYGGYDEGDYGGGGRGQGVTSHGSHDDPWRVELAGTHDRPEEGHRHLIPNGDGTYRMTGPPIPQRKLFEWFVDRYDELTNTGDMLAEARGFYTAWFNWLNGQTDDPLNATVGDGDRLTEWPYPEPVPDSATRRGFHERGFGEGGFNTGGFGD